MLRRIPHVARLFACGVALGLCGPMAFGQQFSIPAGAPPEVRQRMMEQQAKMAEQRKRREGGEKPGGETEPKKGDDSQGKPDDKDASKKDEQNNVVKRPSQPKQQADPNELEVAPDDDGMISFQFQGQPWTALIEWYGRISGKAIDWLELPGDFLNIRTQRKYTLEETQDLLNRHLLARGYTILEDGEFLMIDKTADINSALVPRFAPEELSRLMPYSYVRTSFRLNRLIAEDVAKELEPLKSKNGRLNAMATTNRIEAMDAVTNLRQIYNVLQQERNSGVRTIEEFVLKHVRAADVRKKLEELLGIEKGKTPAMTPQQMQQMQQMQQRREQMRQQNGGNKPPEPKDDNPISFVVNEARNSVIAKAPPDKMFQISETIDLLDVPTNQGGSLDSYLARIRTYRLETLDPTEVVNILFETGGMDPSTTLRVDSNSKAIIASAPPWDHLVIEKLVNKLDGSARQFKVVRLRRRRADQVATTIETLMVGGKKEEDSRSRRRYSWWDNNAQDEKENEDEFRVGADVEHNWLLLWCNENEYEEVKKLLGELGEITASNALNRQMRVLEGVPGENEAEFLRRVREAFKSMAPNPVILPETQTPSSDRDVEETIIPGETDGRTIRLVPETQTQYVQAELRNLAGGPNSEGQDADRNLETDARSTSAPTAGNVSPSGADAGMRRTGQPEPIIIERDASGKLIIRSKDMQALDMFEELMAQMAPTNDDYHVFTLKYASATWVSIKLEDFFEDEEDDQPRFPFFFFGEDDSRDNDKPAGLGDRRALKFISEIDTNTILVRNATPDQIVTIQELINIYDVPEPMNNQAARFIESYQLKYAKARVVETVLKDVFRDLLSTTDKAFQRQNNENESRDRPRGGSFFGGFGDEPTATSPKATFKGKLSFGVDESTNILIVTTEGEKLKEIVGNMVKRLDEAARPTDDVRVLSLPGTTSPKVMKAMLVEMFAAQQAAQQTSQGKEEQQPNGEDRGPQDRPNRGDTRRLERGER